MTFTWIHNSNRKVHQRRMNKLMRLMNKNIEKDELWEGRFICRQAGTQWYSYEDHSGYELWVVLRFIDRLTGQTWEQAETVNHWSFINGHHLWEKMNTFIVEECDVWQQNTKPGSKEYAAMIDNFRDKNGNINWPY